MTLKWLFPYEILNLNLFYNYIKKIWPLFCFSHFWRFSLLRNCLRPNLSFFWIWQPWHRPKKVGTAPNRFFFFRRKPVLPHALSITLCLQIRESKVLSFQFKFSNIFGGPCKNLTLGFLRNFYLSKPYQFNRSWRVKANLQDSFLNLSFISNPFTQQIFHILFSNAPSLFLYISLSPSLPLSLFVTFLYESLLVPP